MHRLSIFYLIYNFLKGEYHPKRTPMAAPVHWAHAYQYTQERCPLMFALCICYQIRMPTACRIGQVFCYLSKKKVKKDLKKVCVLRFSYIETHWFVHRINKSHCIATYQVEKYAATDQGEKVSCHAFERRAALFALASI